MKFIPIVLSVAALASLYWTTNRFHLLEIISYFMVSVVLHQQIFVIFAFNLNLIRVSGIQYQSLFLITSCLTIWLLSSYFTATRTLFQKGLYTIGWVLLVVGLEFCFHFMGVLVLLHWKIIYSFLVCFFVLSGSLCFALWFRKLLQNQVLR